RRSATNGGIRRRPLICAGDSPASSATATSCASRILRTIANISPVTRSPWPRSSTSARIAAARSPATIASASVHALRSAEPEHSGHRLGRARVPLEHLHAARPALGLRDRAQLRAPLRDPAVIVAVDQVGGLERGGGHRWGTLVVTAPPPPPRSRRRPTPAAGL